MAEHEERKIRTNLKTRKIIRDAPKSRTEESKIPISKTKPPPEPKSRFEPRPASRTSSPSVTELNRIAELERELDLVSQQTNQQLRDENRRLKRTLTVQRNRRTYQDDTPEDEMLLAMQLAAFNNESLDPQALREVQIGMALNREDLGECYSDPRIRQRILAQMEERTVRDSMTYEELLALEEQIGSVSIGLSPDQLRKLPKIRFSEQGASPCSSCSICMLDFNPGEELIKLPKCQHLYHAQCISRWFEGKKTCPLCLEEAT